MILKMGHLDSAGRSPYTNRHEIAFYRTVAPALPGRLVPYCFEAVEATDTSALPAMGIAGADRYDSHRRGIGGDACAHEH
jgi:hypothetical protein